jgi:group II intron reverse transcriptase/maturase
MQTSLRGIANRARRNKKARFGDLYRLLNQENLRNCFYQLRKTAAPGVDRVTFEQYEQNLDSNLENLVKRLKEKRYRAKLVRRKYIAKANGKMRPLGIPALEDKLLQIAVAQVLTAIYEEDFLDSSWGYRPGRAPREAGRVLANQLYREKIDWVVEADIRGFFDNISHEWLLRMLAERVEDKAFLKLINKWLKAGILEIDGQVLHPITGTPQGGIVSPILANIYLHYALDLWFKQWVRRQGQGHAMMIRFADDFVCGFQHQQDAERFEKDLKERLAKFSLEVAPEKTRTVPFIKNKPEPNEAFEFLGFEFRWVRRRTGRMGVQRRTAPKKLLRSIAAFTEWIKKARSLDINTIMKTVGQKLRGYYNYYGVQGNSKSLNKLFHECKQLLFKWLNRRSQRRSYTWKAFHELLRKHRIPQPTITEPPYEATLF